MTTQRLPAKMPALQLGDRVTLTAEAEARLEPSDRGDIGWIHEIEGDAAVVGWDSGARTSVPLAWLEAGDYEP